MTQTVTNCHHLLLGYDRLGKVLQRAGDLIPPSNSNQGITSMATQFAQVVRKPIAPPQPTTGSFRGLFGSRPTEQIDANEALFWEGDPAEHIYEIVSGCLRLYKLMADGRRAIMGFMFAGEILGVSLKDRYLFTAEAVTDVKVRRYSRSQMHDSLSRMPGLNREVLAMACDELSAAQDQMLLLGRKTAHERIASFLLTVAKRMGQTGAPKREIELPMTRLDMADFLGLTIETVSRVVTKLKTEGVIALPSPHRVVVRQISALQRAAGDEDAEFAPTERRPALAH
jgi:CRP/FNR family transcriptional regulator